MLIDEAPPQTRRVAPPAAAPVRHRQERRLPYGSGFVLATLAGAFPWLTLWWLLS